MQATKNSVGRLEGHRGRTSLFLGKSAVFSNMVAQVTTGHQVDHQVQVLATLKRVMHVHQEPVNELVKEGVCLTGG